MSAPHATVIAVPMRVPLRSQPTPSILVTRDLTRSIPRHIGLREGDRITRIDERSLTDSGFGERVCTMTKRRFTLGWPRDERVLRHSVRCEPLEHHAAVNCGVFARR